MDFRAMQVFLDPLGSDHAQLFLAQSRSYIHSDEATALEEVRIRYGLTFYSGENNCVERLPYCLWCNRSWECCNDADPRLMRVLCYRAARLFNGPPHCGGPQRYVNRVRRRACDREHHRRGIAEVAIELDRPCTLWQFVVECDQLQVDVRKLLFRVRDVVAQLDINQRKPRKTDGTDSEIGGSRRFDHRILRHRLFYGTSD